MWPIFDEVHDISVQIVVSNESIKLVLVDVRQCVFFVPMGRYKIGKVRYFAVGTNDNKLLGNVDEKPMLSEVLIKVDIRRPSMDMSGVGDH